MNEILLGHFCLSPQSSNRINLNRCYVNKKPERMPIHKRRQIRVCSKFFRLYDNNTARLHSNGAVANI